MSIIDPSLKLNRRERFLRVFRYEEVDHIPGVEFGYWKETLRKWHNEGLPWWVKDNYTADIYFGFEAWYWNKVPIHIPFRPFKRKVLKEDDRIVIVRDETGIVKIEFKEGKGTSTPKYIEFPVKNWNAWQEYKERWDLDNITYPENWEELKEKYEKRDYSLGIDAGGFWLGQKSHGIREFI